MMAGAGDEQQSEIDNSFSNDLVWHSFSLDWDLRAVRVTTAGFYSVTDAEHYIAALKNYAGECRRLFGKLRIIVNAFDSPVQPPEVADRLSRLPEILAPGDKIAIIVKSILVKGQLERRIGQRNVMTFSVDHFAEAWLKEDSRLDEGEP